MTIQIRRRYHNVATTAKQDAIAGQILDNVHARYVLFERISGEQWVQADIKLRVRPEHTPREACALSRRA